ncbi:hypothetical protein [Pseudomonas japonica]|uniref:Uncharacterized protein n=1 Tax=Pseudomonas japonica TaxID=256466 RepID=A0A239C1T9_9PSED|nr:hypothetical protein [Pseudomonas japonica]SNS14116.1 hypothetical protein SAMN05444352_103324 [Pseudomonas japonica]
MQQKTRNLNEQNIHLIKEDFERSLSDLGASVQGKSGVALLTSMKRDKVGVGPYPDVTLFEAANRIMSDLVILNGIAGLLREKSFPFTEYTVEFGNEDKNGFDIRASSPTQTLIGEAFNVAPSFFQGKKSSALKKLRAGAADSSYKILMFNADAPPKGYSARHEADTYHVSVDISNGAIAIHHQTPIL